MPIGQVLFAGNALTSLHRGVLLAILLGAVLIGFVALVLLISMWRRHRLRDAQPARHQPVTDPWSEAGRRVHVDPLRPRLNDSQGPDSGPDPGNDARNDPGDEP